jgi:hypothetical protein
MRGYEQVDVIGHETERMKETTRARQEPGKVKKIKLPILRREETSRAVIAALKEVHRGPGNHDARVSRHVG